MVTGVNITGESSIKYLEHWMGTVITHILTLPFTLYNNLMNCNGCMFHVKELEPLKHLPGKITDKFSFTDTFQCHWFPLQTLPVLN